MDRPGRYLCSNCLNRLPFIPINGNCRKCGRTAEKLDGEFLCEDCRVYKPAFDRVGSVLKFDNEAREMINGFKFRQRLHLRNDFTDWMEALARSRFNVNEIDVVSSVPIGFWRRIDRGYNQCDILARALSNRLNKPYLPRLLKRVGSSRRQSELNEEERRKNIIGAFAVRKADPIRGKTVLIVDDIMTTGSTLSEIASILKASGANRVWAITLARSIHT